MLTVTLLGTGSPIPDPNRAGPATLISAGDDHYLVDAGRGVLMRLAGAGVGIGQLRAVLLTHLHSDHFTDLNDVITTRWVMNFDPNAAPLIIVGPVGTKMVVDSILASLGPDVAYRIAHHDDLTSGPALEVIEVVDGAIDLPGAASIRCDQTDHKPVEPSVGFRLDYQGAAVVAAGDTVPCEGLDRLCSGADAVVHTTIRKDIIKNLPIARMQDTLDYHSSPEEAAQTAKRANLQTLILTHYVPTFASGDDAEWRALAGEHFDGTIELGDDLHQVTINAR